MGGVVGVRLQSAHAGIRKVALYHQVVNQSQATPDFKKTLYNLFAHYSNSCVYVCEPTFSFFIITSDRRVAHFLIRQSRAPVNRTGRKMEMSIRQGKTCNWGQFKRLDQGANEFGNQIPLNI